MEYNRGKYATLDWTHNTLYYICDTQIEIIKYFLNHQHESISIKLNNFLC